MLAAFSSSCLIASFAGVLLAPAAAVPAAEGIAVDVEAGSVSVPAVVAKQGVYEVLKGAIEYLLVAKGGKAYEALFVTEHSPGEIQAALAKIGFEAGKPAGAETPPSGMAVRVLVEHAREDGKGEDGKTVRRDAGELVLLRKTRKPLAPGEWVYTGSSAGFDPESDKEVLQCALTKSIVGLHLTDASPLVQNPRPEARTENIYEANLEALPAEGTAVRIVFERVVAEVAAGTQRVRVFVSGRVQGVGYRAFVERAAKRLGVAGFVKNLEDGRVEAVAQGSGEAIEKLLAELRKGPRAAKVEKVDVRSEPPAGGLTEFKIEY
jgi:acylphosphatase